VQLDKNQGIVCFQKSIPAELTIHLYSLNPKKGQFDNHKVIFGTSTWATHVSIHAANYWKSEGLAGWRGHHRNKHCENQGVAEFRRDDKTGRQ
jgi:hypothetical protein